MAEITFKDRESSGPESRTMIIIKSDKVIDASKKYRIIHADYLGNGTLVVSLDWLQYIRKWKPTTTVEAQKDHQLLVIFFDLPLVVEMYNYTKGYIYNLWNFAMNGDDFSNVWLLETLSHKLHIRCTPRPTRSYTNSDTNRNITQEEAPGFEHVRPRTKISHSEQQPFVPVTPAVKRSRSRDPTQDSNTRNKRQNVVAGSSCCLRLTPEKTIENRSYQLETLAHKNHKGKCDQREVKAQKYEEDRKEVFVLEYTKCDGAEQTSQASVDVEVNGITRKKQVYEFGQTHQEAESKLKQPESSSPRQQSCSNTLIPYEIKSHIEEQVIAAVSSHVEALKSKMNMMMEEKMKQMFDDLRKTDKAGVKPARGIRKLLGKRKE